MAARSTAVARGPTVATLRAIEDVLRGEGAPMSRYAIRQSLNNRIAQPLLDEAINYMAEHAMVYDEGPGGKVVWIQVSERTRARLRGK
jgi:hypothetical protein